MTFLLRYWRPLAALLIAGAALGGMWWWGYQTKAMACDLAAMSLQNAQLQAQRAEIAYWQEQAHKADEALSKALERKPAAPTIREVIRENPSDCRLPEPVARGLRDEIDRANAAGSSR